MSRIIELGDGAYASVHGEPSDDPATEEAIRAVCQAALKMLKADKEEEPCSSS